MTLSLCGSLAWFLPPPVGRPMCSICPKGRRMLAPESYLHANGRCEQCGAKSRVVGWVIFSLLVLFMIVGPALIRAAIGCMSKRCSCCFRLCRRKKKRKLKKKDEQYKKGTRERALGKLKILISFCTCVFTAGWLLHSRPGVTCYQQCFPCCFMLAVLQIKF